MSGHAIARLVRPCSNPAPSGHPAHGEAPDWRSPPTPPAPPESYLERSRVPGWPGERDPRGNSVRGRGASATTASGRRLRVRNPCSFRRTPRKRESLTANAGQEYYNPDRRSNTPPRSLSPATREQTSPSRRRLPTKRGSPQMGRGPCHAGRPAKSQPPSASAIGAASHGREFIRRDPALFAPFPRRSLRDPFALRTLAVPAAPCVFSPAASIDPDLLAVADRIGRIGDDALVLAQAAGDFDLRSEVARDPHLLQLDTVVKPDRRHLRRVVAKQQRAGGQRDRIRDRAELRNGLGRTRPGQGPVVVVGDEFDEQRARFRVDRVRGRRDRRVERAIGIFGQASVAFMPSFSAAA